MIWLSEKERRKIIWLAVFHVIILHMYCQCFQQVEALWVCLWLLKKCLFQAMCSTPQSTQTSQAAIRVASDLWKAAIAGRIERF